MFGKSDSSICPAYRISIPLLADAVRDTGFINVTTRFSHIPIRIWLQGDRDGRAALEPTVGGGAASGHSEEIAEHWTQQHNEQSNDYSYC